ncbi:MAG: hypothetical protein ABJD11_15420 [Gemmatimonadota bacterium]
MKRIAIAMVLSLSSAGLLSAQAVQEQKPGQLQQARVKPDSARKAVLELFPGSTVSTVRIGSGQGGLAYTFDLAHAGMTGQEEAVIDAQTGRLVQASHRGPGSDFRQQTLGSRNPPPDPDKAEAHPEINSALLALDNAKTHLEHADHDFGGHRVQALQAIETAMQQLKLAVEYDRTH